MSTSAITTIAMIVMGVLLLGGLGVASLIGLGFYLGWFRMRSAYADETVLEVIEDKIQAHKDEARAKGRAFESQVTGRVTAPTVNGKASAVAPAKHPEN
jgi:hypothetical protein